jgi:hypothetical protein
MAWLLQPPCGRSMINRSDWSVDRGRVARLYDPCHCPWLSLPLGRIVSMGLPSTQFRGQRGSLPQGNAIPGPVFAGMPRGTESVEMVYRLLCWQLRDHPKLKKNAILRYSAGTCHCKDTVEMASRALCWHRRVSLDTEVVPSDDSSRLLSWHGSCQDSLLVATSASSRLPDSKLIHLPPR